MEDYYQILGVSPYASQEELKERYRFLAQAYHPDKFGTSTHKRYAEDIFKKINEAYHILNNPDRRTRYDRERATPNSKYDEERHRREEAEAARQHAREEQKRREQDEANKRRAEEELIKRKETEAAHNHAKYDWFSEELRRIERRTSARIRNIYNSKFDGPSDTK